MVRVLIYRCRPPIVVVSWEPKDVHLVCTSYSQATFSFIHRDIIQSYSAKSVGLVKLYFIKKRLSYPDWPATVFWMTNGYKGSNLFLNYINWLLGVFSLWFLFIYPVMLCLFNERGEATIVGKWFMSPWGFLFQQLLAIHSFSRCSFSPPWLPVNATDE